MSTSLFSWRAEAAAERAAVESGGRVAVERTVAAAARVAIASLGVVCHPHTLAMAIAKAAERATNCHLVQLRIGANAIECAAVTQRAAYGLVIDTITKLAASGQHTAVKRFWQADSNALPTQALAWRPTLWQSSQRSAIASRTSSY